MINNLHTYKEKLFLIFCILIPPTIFISRDLTIFFIIISSILWLIRLNFKDFINDLKTKKFIWLFLGLYLLFVISSLYSKNFKEALKHLEIKAGILIYPILLGTLTIKNKNFLKYIFISFSIGWFLKFSISLFAAINEFYFIKGNHIKNFFNDFHFFIVEFHDKLNFHYVYFSIAYIFIYIFISEILIKNKKLWTFLFFTLISYFFILIIQSRIAIIIILILSNINFFRLIKVKYNLAEYLQFIMFFLFNAFLIITLLYLLNHSKLLDRFKSQSINIRKDIIDISLKNLKKNDFNIFFGDGLGDSHVRLFNAYKENHETIYFQEKLNYHNQYLEILFSNGILGLFYLIFMFSYLFIFSLKKKKYLYTLFLIIIIISFITESWLNTFNGVFLFAFFNCILSFYFLNNEKNDSFFSTIH